MSKEYCCFESESGKTAFLSGVVDVLSDTLSRYCEYPWYMDADIFYAPDQDLSQLTEAVKKRMHSYYSILNEPEPKTDIDAMDFTDMVREEYAAKPQMTQDAAKVREKTAEEKADDEFMRQLEWHLGKPVCTYKPADLPDKNIGVLGYAYMSFALHYYFIAYEEYMVLMIFGTTE